MKTHYFQMLMALLLLFSCKKIDRPVPKTTISINPSIVTLKNDQAFLGARLTADIKHLPAGHSDVITWSSENIRIASVKQDGTVWAEGAGETNVVATLANGLAAKCKVIVTDANDYKYRIVLKDKGPSNFTISNPSDYLSPKAIQRRLSHGIAIDAEDLPISAIYLDAIQKAGGIIVAKSKWLNTVTIHSNDQFLIDKYKELPFVKEVVLVWKGKRVTSPIQTYVDVPQLVSNHTSIKNFDYGSATSNISIHNGEELHKKGFKGSNIDIAILDAGFINLKNNASFKNVNIKGAKSFVYENSNPYSVDNHGIWVTSCMAVNLSGKYVGTAPEANYWLLRTEESDSEYPVEEDYWVNAAEYADSLGVDIINSSLTYTTGYGIVSARYDLKDMDGKTAFASRGANVAFSKGMFIVNCAGNEQSWVGTPADSPNVLTLGAIGKNLQIGSFSSWGFTPDGRIKPDVMALGSGASVIGINGEAESRSGTSYSSPIMCGLVACLWQAYPKLTNQQLIDLLRKSADRANSPVLPYGYGIPDMQKAMQLADELR